MDTFREETLTLIIATERFLACSLLNPPLSTYERDLIASYCERVLHRVREFPTRSAA